MCKRHHIFTSRISMSTTLLNVFSILWIAFNMGTVKPAVLLKRVPRVRVRSRFLAYRNTPRTRTVVSQAFTGLLQQCETRFSCFKSCFP